MTRQELLDDVTGEITSNGNKEITGAVLRTLLTTMINNMPVLGVDNGLRVHDPSAVYQPGDTVVYSGQILVCNTANTTGAFNTSKFDMISGIYVAADITERDNISVRHEGMECYVVSTAKKYQLIGGTANANWAEATSANVHKWETGIETNGQTEIGAPNRELLLFMINGVAYPPSDYTLGGGVGTTQILTWDGSFSLTTGDHVTILYKGAEI